MHKSDQFWSAYERLQRILLNSFDLSPRALAFESVLTAFLDAPEPLPSNVVATGEDLEGLIDRLTNTCSWRERSHVRLCSLHHDQIERCVSSENAPISLVALREARELVTPDDWLLLMSIASGVSYEELSTYEVSAGALRVRTSRARTKLKNAA
jgi:hypothetical protein